jgi:hypothetical protein
MSSSSKLIDLSQQLNTWNIPKVHLDTFSFIETFASEFSEDWPKPTPHQPRVQAAVWRLGQLEGFRNTCWTAGEEGRTLRDIHQRV